MVFRFGAVLFAAVVASVLFVGAPVRAAHNCSAMSGIDVNHDNKLARWEVARAAKRTFYSLNPDGDRTLERDELRGHMGPRAFAAVNRNGDRGIDAFEYKRYVKRLFRRLNPDGDRTLECDEVSTRAGRRLLRLLK